jgi:hypothetical protein
MIRGATPRPIRGATPRPRRGATPGFGVAAFLAALLLVACGGQATAPSVAPSPAVVAPDPTTDPSNAAVGVSTPPTPAPPATPSPVAPSPARAAAATGRLTGEPDPNLTPGAFNPAVTQATIRQTICVSGWTATIRPPSTYTTALKRQQIDEYGYTRTSTALYEEDHLISLELGGAPRDPRNLWPEPWTLTMADGTQVGARVKDLLENKLRRAVCAGTMTLAEARREIGVHWVHYWLGIPVTP